MHCCQRSVVVANQRHVVRDAKAGILEVAEGPSSAEVVRGEDGRWHCRAAEEHRCGGVATGFGEVAGSDEDVLLQAEFGHRLLVAALAGGGTGAAAAADVGDALMTELGEVLDREP